MLGGLVAFAGRRFALPWAAMGIVKRAVMFSSFSFLSLKAVFVFSGCVSSSLAVMNHCSSSAIRTRTVSVPGDDAKSGRGTKRTPSKVGVQQADPSWGPGARRSKIRVLIHQFYFSPSFSGVVLPVFIRHRSMASLRPTATMAFFLAPPLALGLASTDRHFCTGR